MLIQLQYLNNLVEQEHRTVKRRARPILGFNQFQWVAKLMIGIETKDMSMRPTDPPKQSVI
ncbi:hypothetical protein [Undibacterium sp. SXout20W]|uniref:hypothetical protein n=1 Tax=Undibacterium sp. SXout20W TaxID=3413051 RepID=UPI003BF013BF